MRSRSTIIAVLAGLLLLVPASATDAGTEDGQNSLTAVGTGTGHQEGSCLNQYVIQGASTDGTTWTFTVEYNSRFIISQNIILVPCPWAPVSVYSGSWDPSAGGSIPAVGVSGSLSLTNPQPGGGSLGGDQYTMSLCFSGLCSTSGGTAELFLAP